MVVVKKLSRATHSDVTKISQFGAQKVSSNGALGCVPFSELGTAPQSFRVVNGSSSGFVLPGPNTLHTLLKAWRTGFAPKNVLGVCASCSERGVK